MDKRGQFVFEFIMMVVMALFLSVMYLSVTTDLFTETSEQQRLQALNDVGFKIQDEIILAEIVEDGYVRNFTIPEKADRFTYTLTNDNDTLTLTSGQVIVTYSTPLISGSFQKGYNVLKKNGNITVMPG